MFLDYFDMLISKIIFKNKKNIILIHFQIKNTLKNNHNYISKHATMDNPEVLRSRPYYQSLN
jgi:hypothetical protein